MKAQLAGLKLDFELVKAVDGRQLSEEQKRREYNDRKARWRLSRSMNPAEIGIMLSHLSIYRKMQAESIDHALILEDDVTLPDILPGLLDELEEAINGCTKPAAWLLSPAETAGAPIVTLKNHRISLFSRGYFTSSYVVNLAAAEELSKELYPVNDVADCWERIARYGIASVYCVQPAPITQNQAQFGSSTTAMAVGTRPGPTNVFRLMRRAGFLAWDFVYSRYRRWNSSR